MTEIQSRRAGARREDVAARQLIDRNRATIEKIADHLSNGAFSASRQPRPEPQAEGLMIHVLGGPAKGETPLPYVRISPNDRVVLADHASGRQLEFLGQIRHQNGARRFVLATAANGFFAELSPETRSSLEALDGAQLTGEYGEDQLGADIARQLGIT